MSLSALTLAAEAAHSESINHWVIGGVTLLILIALIYGLLAFGAGREHS
jgi:hypothetical protein